MRQSDILKLKEIVAQLLDVDAAVIGDDFNLLEAGFNSITFIKLVLFIENCFSIEFEDEDLSIFILPTLNDLIRYIDHKTENN